MWKSVLLITVLLGITLAANLAAQIRKGDMTIVLQATASFADRTYTYSSSYDSDAEQHSITEISMAVAPAYWFNENIAIELELGYQSQRVEQLYEESSIPSKDNAVMFVPHLVVAMNAVDTTLIPYARGGIGLADHFTTPLIPQFREDLEGDNPAVVLSLSAGAMYLIGDHAMLRAELNYRTHSATGGSNTHMELDYKAFNFFLGVGLRL